MKKSPLLKYIAAIFPLSLPFCPKNGKWDPQDISKYPMTPFPYPFLCLHTCLVL